MRSTRTVTLSICAACVLVVSDARAEVDEDQPPPRSAIGIDVSLGGGITGFTNQGMRSTTSSVGGTWGLSAAFGTHVPLALELGYLGSATHIRAPFSDESALMIGTALEADIRLSPFRRMPINPYVFVGVGWQRYMLEDFAHASIGMNASDDLLVLPAGVGFTGRYSGVVFDLRATLRAARDPSFAPESNRSFAPMSTWAASFAVGREL